jgi:hypothetical protein
LLSEDLPGFKNLAGLWKWAKIMIYWLNPKTAFRPHEIFFDEAALEGRKKVTPITAFYRGA